MALQNIDGVNLQKKTSKAKVWPVQGVRVSSVTILPKLEARPAAKSSGWLVAVVVVIVLAAFSGGAWATWTTVQTKATVKQPVGQISAITTLDPVPLNFDQNQLNVVANFLPVLIEENRHIPTPEELRDKQRKEVLQSYLKDKKSPLAKDDAAVTALLETKNLKMILAISFVESNICIHHVSFNCSGIGGSTYFRKYKNFSAWAADFDLLLETRYKNLSVEEFRGRYVKPGSQNWVDGVYQILDELKAKNIE